MAKTYEELLEQAAIIRDETAAGKNTATRVGGTITDAVDYVKELQDTYKGIHAEASEAKTTANAAKTTAEQAKQSATNAFNSARSAVFTASAAQSTANGIAATAQEAKEAAEEAQTAAETAQTTAATLLQDTPWARRHMNMFTETGEYHIHGERTDANDGLPILNAASGHTIDARLTVLDSSLTNGTGAKTDIVVTQILRLSNRTGGDGHVYVRTAQAANKSQLATPSSTAWGTWEKLMGIFEKNAVKNIADLDTYTTNGMYSGLFAGTTPQNLGGWEFTPGETFLLITVNGYAATAFGTPQLTQMLYRLPAKQGSEDIPASMFMRTAYWDASAKAWTWADWDNLFTGRMFSTFVEEFIYPSFMMLAKGGEEVIWDNSCHLNSFVNSQNYYISGERTNANDGLPILNANPGHTIFAQLSVLDSSLENGTGDKTDICVTQVLRLSNRMGGDGHVYVRTGQAATKEELMATNSTKWGTWEKLMGIFEKNVVANATDLDTYTTNGMYSGLFMFSGYQQNWGVAITPGSTFLLVTVNGYAVSSAGLTPQLTQMLYLLPAKTGSEQFPAKMYIRTAWWNASAKDWVWNYWDKIVTASELSALEARVTALEKK